MKKILRVVIKKRRVLSLRDCTPSQQIGLTTLRATRRFFMVILIFTLATVTGAFAKPVSEGTVKISVRDDALFF